MNKENDMGRRYYTDEEKTEILANPYTFRMTDTQVFFTLEFKKMVVKEKRNGLINSKIFEKAGYDKDFFTVDVRNSVVRKILAENNSKQGLVEPKLPKYTRSNSKKKHRATEVKELEARVDKLEKMIEFLKKTQFVDKKGRIP